MSSMLTQFEDGTAPKTNSNSNAQPRQDPASYSMHETIPSYSEAIEEAQLQDANNANANTNAIPAPTPSIEEPPSYTLLDSTQTTFTIFGTFIHTPAGPAYQLSSPLDQRGPYFRIRRLRPKEVAQVGVSPLAFDRSNLLYEVNDPPLLENEYHMQGKRRTCLPGVIVMKFRIQRWHIKHVPRPGAEKKEILTCKKVGAFGRTKLNKSREMEASEWKDAQGQVLATEVFKIMENGDVVPTVELREGLDQTWRELLLSLWATRLWVAYGNQKTAVQGGRYGQVRFAKYAGSGIVAGGSAGVGLTVIGLSGAGGI